MRCTSDELAALLRIGAQGDRPAEAAVELLIGHGVWLRRSDFVSACVTVESGRAGSAAFIDWPAAVCALDAGELPCSSSEASVLRIAAGLGGVPVDLRARLCGLDANNILLVADAVLHANGTPGRALARLFGAQSPRTTPRGPARPITQAEVHRDHG